MVSASPSHESRSAGSIEVRPMSVFAGAEIFGVDLTRPLAPQAAKEIWAALLKWKVVFFRDQHIDHAQHVAFARQLGKPTVGHVLYGHEDAFPEIYSVAKEREKNTHQEEKPIRPWSGWHTDLTTLINPPAASILRGVTIPPYGGDTQFTNLVAAYDALSPTMRTFVDGLRGIHGYAKVTANALTQTNRKSFSSEHPIVRVHPETGERALFVSPAFLRTIVGLSARESQQILEFLWEHVVRPEFVVRFRWNAGDIAMWDNRATAHLAPEDIFETDFDRQLYRITLVGDIPVGVDGVPSTSIVGDILGPAQAAE
ncbi:MAG: taurine dioxygenase [Rhodospirillales bacterium]|jgi:taurine dioxygenase|nr:taurine dioxygenase [Rhodospirillales bacterium]